MDIREEIINICSMYSNETNEDKLINTVEKSIEKLRSEWKINREKFRKEDVIDLKIISLKLTAIKRLVYIVSHPECIREKSYPVNATSNLHKLEEEIRGMAIEEKINRQIMKIIELNSELPSNRVAELKRKLLKKKVSGKSISYQDVLLKLKLEAPICPRCGIKMILREGKHLSFYGCDDYPKCTGKKPISRRTNELINRLDPRNQY